eukprot:scpid7402/ scgid1050/ EF-hand calcium-binding domain-containing protein 5
MPEQIPSTDQSVNQQDEQGQDLQLHAQANGQEENGDSATTNDSSNVGSAERVGVGLDLSLNVTTAAAKWQRKTRKSGVQERLRQRQLNRIDAARLRPAKAVYSPERSAFSQPTASADQVACSPPGTPTSDGNTLNSVEKSPEREAAAVSSCISKGTAESPVHVSTNHRGNVADKRNRFIRRQSSVQFEKIGEIPMSLPPVKTTNTSDTTDSPVDQQVTAMPSQASQQPARPAGRAVDVTQSTSLKAVCEQWLRLLLDEEDLASEDSVQRAHNMQTWLVVNLIPTITICLSKVLERAERQHALRNENPQATFSPINALAENLMRHNPKYAFAEVSSYDRAMKSVRIELEDRSSDLMRNALAQARRAAKDKARAEKESIDTEKEAADFTRFVLSDALVEGWTWKDLESGKSSVRIASDSILAIMEDCINDPAMQELFDHSATPGESMFSQRYDILPIDEEVHSFSGESAIELIMLVLNTNSKDFVAKFARKLREEGLRLGLELASIHKSQLMRQAFAELDTAEAMMLNRHKLLVLMENFYTSLPDSDVDKQLLTCPCQFPVVDILELAVPPSHQLDSVPEGDSMEGMTASNAAKADVTSLQSMLVQGRPLSRLAERGRQVPSSMDTLIRMRTASRKAMSARYGVVAVKLAELRSRPTPTPVPPLLVNELSHTRLDEVCVSRDQFSVMIKNFLGAADSRYLNEFLQFLKQSYRETEIEESERRALAQHSKTYREEVGSIDELFDMIDYDQTGAVACNQVLTMLAGWKHQMADHVVERVKEFLDVSEDNDDITLNRREFQHLIRYIGRDVDEEDATDMRRALHEATELSEAERTRTEKNRLGLASILSTGSWCSLNPRPAFEAVFHTVQLNLMSFDKDRKVSCAVALFDKPSDGGERHLQFVATSPEDTYMVGETIPMLEDNPSYKAVETGKTVHVADIRQHGAITVFNEKRAETVTGAFLAVPILHVQTRQPVGVLTMDSMQDTVAKPFANYEQRFAERVAGALSHVLYTVERRMCTLIVLQETMCWACRCLRSVKSCTFYMVTSPVKNAAKRQPYSLKKVITFLGLTPLLDEHSPNIENSSAALEYLFSCVDTSLPVTKHIEGKVHIVCPVRDQEGAITSVLDFELEPERDNLLPVEQEKLSNLLQRMTIAQNDIGGPFTSLVECWEKRESILQTKVDSEYESSSCFVDDLSARIAFTATLLADVQHALKKLSKSDIHEFKTYRTPPGGIQLVFCLVKSMLSLAAAGQPKIYSSWAECQQAMVHDDLREQMLSFDPLNMIASREMLDELDDMLLSVRIDPAELAAPIGWVHEWCVACLALLQCNRRLTAVHQGLDDLQSVPTRLAGRL